MKDIDLHGKRLLEAEKIFEAQLNDARLKSKWIEIQFITGAGPIRDRILALAQEHGLHHYIPMHNRGCIVVEFE